MTSANTTITITTLSGTVGSANQTLTGKGLPGASIVLWNGNTQVGSTTVGSNGTWSADVTLNLGNNSLTANMLTTLGNFKPSVGLDPNGNLIQDAAGNLFGTASQGGTSGKGSVFELSGSNLQTLSNVVSFSGSSGSYPASGLIQDSSGNFYGTTQMGGPNGANGGTVFELSGPNHQTLTTLYSFDSGNTIWPMSNLVMSPSGNLFGATLAGGSASMGTIFQLSGSNFQNYSTVVNFNGSNGYQPNYLLMDPSGTIYGLTTYGGTNNMGTLFVLSGTSSATLTTLFNFSGQTGNYPTSLIEDASGNLFGVTLSGGTMGAGTIFELSGANHQNFAVLFNFPASNLENPSSNLVIDSAGYLYGEISSLNGGSIFELSGSNYQTFTPLFSFNGSNGAFPNQLAFINGALYGVTSNGGANQNGTIYLLTATSSATKLTYVPSSNLKLTPSAPSVSQGGLATFKLTTSNVSAGTVIYYTLSSTDMNLLYGSQAVNSTLVGSDGTALIQVPVGFDGVVQTTPQSLSVSLSGIISTVSINPLPPNVTNSIGLSKSSFTHGENIAINLNSNFLSGTVYVRVSGMSANYFVMGNGALQADGSIMYPVNLINGVASLNLGTQVSTQVAQYGTLGLNANNTQMNFQVSLCTSAGFIISSQKVAFNEPSITSLMANQSSVTEGNSATFTLKTSNILSGTTLSYSLQGLDASILNQAPSTGSFQVSSSSQTLISIPTVVPFANLGPQNFSLTVGNLVTVEALSQPSFPTLAWTAVTGVSNNWNLASSWSAGALPNASTNVNLTNSSTTTSASVSTSGVASANALTLSNTNLTVLASSSLSVTHIKSTQSVISVSGSLSVAGSVLAYGAINLSGGAIAATNITGSFSTISGYGSVSGNFTGANAFNVSALGANVTSPTLKVVGDLSLITSTAYSTIGAGATLELNNKSIAAFNVPVQMLDTNATLKLDTPYTYMGSISSFILGDNIDLVGVIASSVSYSGGILSVVSANGKTLSLNLSGSLSGSTPTFSSDGAGGTLVTFPSTLTPTYALKASTSTLNEGQAATFQLTTTNLPAGSVVPYTLSGVTPSDLASGQISGTLTLDKNGQASLSIPTLTHVNNLGNKTLTVSINPSTSTSASFGTSSTTSTSTLTSSTSTSTSTVASATTLLVDNASSNSWSFNLVAKTQSLIEGNNAIFLLTSSNVPNGTVAQFSISGNVGKGDYTLSSNLAVFANGQATISIPTTVHSYSLGNKTLTLNVDGQSASETLVDNAPAAPVYTLTPSAASVNAGQTVIFYLNTQNVAFGSTVNYTVSGVSAANILSGQLSGSVMIASPGIATIAIPTIPTSPSSTYVGNKTMTISVGDIGGVSASETLIDTAAQPTYSLSANASSVNFGAPASFQLSTTNLANATQVFYTLSGVSAASDLGLANLTGSVNIDPSGKATITIPTLNHNSFQGNKTLTLTVNGQTASEVLVDTNPAYNVSAMSASVVEGNSANFVISTVNVPVGTSLPYTISGTVAASDLSGGALSGSVIIGAGGGANINLSSLTHPSFQGNKTLTLTLGNSSATETLIDNAPVVPDQFDGTYLSINKLMVGTTPYSNLVVTVSSVLSVGNGMPTSTFDAYNATAQTLSAPIIKFGNTIYTNVVLQLTPNNIIAQNGGLLSPPIAAPANITLLSETPLNKSSAPATSDVTFTFSQFITPSAGSITITDPNGQQSVMDLTSNPYVVISGNTLTVLHSNFYQKTGAYQFNIPNATIHGISGGNFAGVNDYSVYLTGLTS